jgi:Fe-S-cluster containining protein
MTLHCLLLPMPHHESAEDPAMKGCTNCGKCCTSASYMGSLIATGEDVKRWMREGRDDILEWVAVMGCMDDPWADLWINANTGVEVGRCPFVRKVRGTNRYLCRIYDTRPQVCRDYIPWAPGSVCEDV